MHRREVLFFGGLCALCLLPAVILWPYRDAAFVSDDRWFTSAPLLDSSGRWLLAPWPHPFGPAHAYRPLIVFSYAVTQWWASSPAPFHLTNFLVHGVNAMLLAGMIWQVSRSRAAGLIAGLLFAIHPITHENIVWISGRTYAIAATFGLALLWWTAADADRDRPRWWQHAVGLCLLLCALLSYETAMVLPVLVALVRLCRPQQRVAGRATATDRVARWIEAARFTAPYLVLLAIYLLFRWTVISPIGADSEVWRHGTNPSPDLVVARIRVMRNVSTLILRMTNADNTWTFATTVALALTGLAAWGIWIGREIRWLALGALAMAAVAYAPAVVGPAYLDRLTYLTAAGILAALALGLSAVVQDTRVTGRIDVTLGVLLMSCCLIVRYHELANDWQHAGEISESLLDQLVKLEPAPAAGEQMHFVDVPSGFGEAYAYITYFHYSVQQRYARPDLEIITHRPDEIPALLASWHGSMPNAALFRWDAGTERLLREWPRD